MIVESAGNRLALMVSLPENQGFCSRPRRDWGIFNLIQAPEEFDKRLLRLLQADARLSTQDLAERAGLSASPSWRRVRRLEQDGIIRKHVAMLDPKKLGLHAVAYVHVSLLDHTEATIARFDAFVQEQDQV